MALTEGVVRSMALFKLKVMTAALFVACALGFGAFAATGAVGDGPAGQQQQKQGPTGPVAVKPADPLPPVRKEKPAEKPVTDRDRLQGTWRVVSLTEGEKTTPTDPKAPWVVEISGNTLKMPYLEGGGSSSSSSSGSSTGGSSSSGTSTATAAVWKQREYTFVVDETKVPRTIDLTANKKAVARHL